MLRLRLTQRELRLTVRHLGPVQGVMLLTYGLTDAHVNVGRPQHGIRPPTAVSVLLRPTTNGTKHRRQRVTRTVIQIRLH